MKTHSGEKPNKYMEDNDNDNDNVNDNEEEKDDNDVVRTENNLDKAV